MAWLSRVLRALPVPLLLLLAGCTADLENPCGCSVQPEEPGARGVFEANESILWPHPTLYDLFHSIHLPDGTGSSVDCDEGVRALDDFEEQGADVRRYDSYGGDLYVRFEGETYFVQVSRAVAH